MTSQILQANNSITMHMQRNARLILQLRGGTVQSAATHGAGKKALFDARDIKQTLKVQQEAEVEWRRASASIQQVAASPMPPVASPMSPAAQQGLWQLSNTPPPPPAMQQPAVTTSDRPSPSPAHPQGSPSTRKSFWGRLPSMYVKLYIVGGARFPYAFLF